jgi:hypothetical protein
MDEMIIANSIEGLTITQPKMQCPIHGVIDDGYVCFYIGKISSAPYCLRCAVDTFARLGVSVVTPIDAKTE